MAVDRVFATIALDKETKQIVKDYGLNLSGWVRVKLRELKQETNKEE